MNEWIEWEYTEEKPYPETLDTCVYVKFADGTTDEDVGEPRMVGYWHGYGASNWNPADCFSTGYIVAYKVAS